MRLRPRHLLLGAILHLAAAAAWTHAQPACTRLRDGDGLQLAGTIGSIAVRMYLDTGYPARGGDGVSGAYLPSAALNPGAAAIGLEGTVSTDCRLALYERSGSGTWDVRLDADGISGTRTADGVPLTTITLRIAPPVDCSGTGRWRTFAAPSWPVTFSYPLSWRLIDVGNTVTLECPDPARLSWGGGAIRIAHDAGDEDVRAEDGRRGKRMGDFVTLAAEQWLIGDETCTERRASELPSLFCQPARHAKRHGMLVLQGSFGEDRNYAPGGGYSGQGPGIIRYLFVLDRRWVALDSRDRMRPAALDAPGHGGPLTFDGDDVTSRMVRSIRRR